MVEDRMLREVREAKEDYSRKHNYDLKAIFEGLDQEELAETWKFVSFPPRPVDAPTPKAVDAA
ncbi:MAG: hypothetical protein K2W96_27070 [Gemmataceae bacterium]|nr:hypothetical protein [Gemmataceae bacterium]